MLNRKIGLLLILYIIQAVPFGLSAAVPLLLKSRGISFNDVGKYSLSSLPFSIKLLWAPIVDSTRLPGMGRRKSWLLPAQVRRWSPARACFLILILYRCSSWQPC